MGNVGESVNPANRYGGGRVLAETGWVSHQMIEAPCEAPVATREYSDRMPSL